MSPILTGVIASGISGNLSTNSYESIATITVGSATGSITFSSIPSTYTHLQIRCISQIGSGNGNQVMSWNFNGDTTISNYRTHYLSGIGNTSVSSGDYSTLGNILGAQTASPSGYSTSIFGVAIIDILDYANTNKYKVTRALTGFDTNNASSSPGSLWYSSGLWRSTSAINSITIKDYASSLNLNQYSSFALYGVK